MKNIVLIFLMLVSIVYSQEKTLKNGSIITNELDTLNVKIFVLEASQSLVLIKYLDAHNKIRRISTKDAKSYQRGNEYFKAIKDIGNYRLFAKEILKGFSISMYGRLDAGESANRMFIGGSAYNSIYLENRYGISINVPYGKKRFRKRISNFLSEHPDVAKKVKNGELTGLTEIVNQCNFIYY